MLRTFDIVLIVVMTAAATVTYTIKHRAENKLEEVRRLAETMMRQSGAPSLTAAIKTVEAENGPIEVLVANAGITDDQLLLRMSDESFETVLDTNLTGVFNMTHGVWNGMRDRKFGRVINISSINGQKGQFGQTNYAAAKAGA